MDSAAGRASGRHFLVSSANPPSAPGFAFGPPWLRRPRAPRSPVVSVRMAVRRPRPTAQAGHDGGPPAMTVPTKGTAT